MKRYLVTVIYNHGARDEHTTYLGVWARTAESAENKARKDVGKYHRVGRYGVRTINVVALEAPAELNRELENHLAAVMRRKAESRARTIAAQKEESRAESTRNELLHMLDALGKCIS